MIQTAIQKVIEQQDLSREEAFSTMEQIMSGDATPAQIGAFLVALRLKGETPSEIAGFAESMRNKATKVRTTQSAPLMDIVELAATANIRSMFPPSHPLSWPERGSPLPNMEIAQFPVNVVQQTS